MLKCVHCGDTEDVHLFDVRRGDRVDRQWWCLHGAWIEYRKGTDIQKSPAWIERAALRRLPVRDLLASSRPRSERRTGTADRRTGLVDRRAAPTRVG